MAKRVLVTAALPYANGSIHLGHMLEFIQTDVYVRARRQAGEDVIFMWADDTHGTPIQLRARKEGITPEQLIENAYAEHKADFDAFGIGYDIFYSTHSPENEKHAGAIFKAMEAKGDTTVRPVEQLFCPHDDMFLPDRFVKGTCPFCKMPDQYGDVCENCGKTYSPTELAEPACSICGTTPRLESTDHVFVPLSRHADFLRGWLHGENARGVPRVPINVRNYVGQWVEDGLADWDISRDKPYFGFEIPGHPGKFFYVWFDAPIGYIAATDKWCQQSGRDFDSYWKSTEEETEIVHVIGKDIVYFHTLFWPAMLHASGYTTPSRVQVHGYLQVDGTKMSKSRGTFILARTYLDHLPAEYLRYYFAAKLDDRADDFDLNLEDFVNRVNADLTNKAANLASRCIKFLSGKLGGTVSSPPEDAKPLIEKANALLAEAPALFRDFAFSKVLRQAIELAEETNVYLNDAAPWKLAKSDPEKARAICTVGIQISKAVGAVLAPVLPQWGHKLERMLHMEGALDFETAAQPLPPGLEVGPYETLAERIDPKKVEAIIEAGKAAVEPEQASGSAGSESAGDYQVEPLADEGSIDDFAPVDLRVGEVLACEAVEGSKKLLAFTVSLGPLGTRNIFSGVKLSYPDPGALVGKKVVVYANLKPRKMRFGVSEGMILAAGAADDAVTLLELAQAAKPGEKIT